MNDPKKYSTTKKEDDDDLKTDDAHHRKNIIASSKFEFTTYDSLQWLTSPEELLNSSIISSFAKEKGTMNFVRLLIANDTYKYNLTSIVLHADNFAGWFGVKVIGISFTSTIDKNHAFPFFFIVIPTTICSSAWAFMGW